MNMNINPSKLALLAGLGIIYLVWGTTYLAIRIAIETIPPLSMVGARYLMTALILFGWAYSMNHPRPTLRDWKRSAVVGILLIFFASGSIAWTEQFIPSGLVALIVASLPIWLAIVDWLSSGESRPDRYTISGFILGSVGVGIISFMGKQGVIENARIDGSLILGILLLSAASIAWAIGSLYSRKTESKTSLQYLIAMQALTGGTLVMLLGVIRGEWIGFSISQVSMSSSLALGYLVVFGTIIAYSTYVWLIKVGNPTIVGTYAYVNPVIALVLGAVLISEPLNTQMLIGTGFILLAIFLVNKPIMLMESLRTRLAVMFMNPEKQKLQPDPSQCS